MVFTLCRIVKWSVAESVPDRASLHTRNAALEAVSAPEQSCFSQLLKVGSSVSDRFLKRSDSGYVHTVPDRFLLGFKSCSGTV